MTTMRKIIEDFKESGNQGGHPSLVLDYGLSAFDSESKSAAIKKVIQAAATHRHCLLYKTAYARWFARVERECESRAVKLRDRMHIGMGMPSVLETNVTLHPLYGLPMIPGDTLKGALRAHCKSAAAAVEGNADHADWQRDFDTLFGKLDREGAMGGAIVVHDAWWIPGGADSPLCLEVDTPHQRAYYKSCGNVAASDYDNPNPVSELAVQGSFLIAIEKRWLPDAWASFALDLLHEALEHGIGGRVNAGYGRFNAKARNATS